MAIDTCVIVSHYNERPTNELINLLRQLRHYEAGEFQLRVIVNSDSRSALQLPDDLSSVKVNFRENSGFNIGGWDAGWRMNPDFKFYIFLQDECQIAAKNWLDRYKTLLSRRKAGLVGESLIDWSDWRTFEREWPQAAAECASLSLRKSIPLGRSPTHLQTLALGASGSCLAAMDGFLLGGKKVEAIATEIMISRNCKHCGFDIAQSAWRPFQYIEHPQWASMKQDSEKVSWHIWKAMKYVLRP